MVFRKLYLDARMSRRYNFGLCILRHLDHSKLYNLKRHIEAGLTFPSMEGNSLHGKWFDTFGKIQFSLVVSFAV